jgi:hypothetical protein
LPVGLSSPNAAVATVLNNKIHLVSAGTMVITASQEGNDSYQGTTGHLPIKATDKKRDLMGAAAIHQTF